MMLSRTLAFVLATTVVGLGCKSKHSPPSPESTVDPAKQEPTGANEEVTEEDDEWKPKPIGGDKGIGGGPMPTEVPPSEPPPKATAPKAPKTPKPAGSAPSPAPSASAPGATWSVPPWLQPGADGGLSIPTWPWAAPSSAPSAAPSAAPSPGGNGGTGWQAKP